MKEKQSRTMDFQLHDMRKLSKWALIPVMFTGLGFTAAEATIVHNSELFIASATILALVVWITLVSLCVIGFGKFLR